MLNKVAKFHYQTLFTSQIIQQNGFRVSCWSIWWRLNISISQNITFDYLKNEKSFRGEIKNILLVSRVLSFRHKRQTCKNIADTTFNELIKKDSIRNENIYHCKELTYLHQPILCLLDNFLMKYKYIQEELTFHSGVHKRYQCLQSSHKPMSAVRFGEVTDNERVFRFYFKNYVFLNNQISVSVYKTKFDCNVTFVFQWYKSIISESTISNIVNYACCFTGCDQRTKKLVHNIRCVDFIIIILF